MKRILSIFITINLILTPIQGLTSTIQNLPQDGNNVINTKNIDIERIEEYDESKHIIKQDRTLELRSVEELYPEEKPQLVGYDVIHDKHMGGNTYPSNAQPYSYNSYLTAAADATNLITEPRYSMTEGFDEYISPYSGEMTLKFDDISLSGPNGLDFNIGRTYQTNQALLGSKYYDPVTGKQTYDSSTYLQNRFNLGSGWSLAIPSIEVYGDPDDLDDDPELYYHTGNGKVYRVNFNANTKSNFEGYHAKDMIFENDYNGTSNNNLSGTPRFYVQFADQSRQYFAKDGRLLGIVDRFGNNINYVYERRPVSNIVPNGLFQCSENVGLWERSNPNIMNYGNGGYMQFYSSSFATAHSQSTFIPVEANEEYTLNAWLDFGSILSERYTGTVKITVYYYDQDQKRYSLQPLYTERLTEPNAGWRKLQFNLSIPEDKHYVKIKLENINAKGLMFFDNVCMDKNRYLLTQIGDNVGRYAYIDYGKYLYDKDANDFEDITISIGTSKNSIERVLRYHRHRIECEWKKYIPSEDPYYEISYFWTLAQYSENNQIMQTYEYTADGVVMPEYFSFTSNTRNVLTDGKVSHRPLITAVIINNTKFKYNYSMTTKWLGTTGYYETNRIASRKLYYSLSNNTWDTTEYDKLDYTYYNNSDSTLNGANETGFPNEYYPEYPFHTLVTDAVGLETIFYWEGNKLVEKVTDDSTSDTTITETYDYNDIYLPDYITNIHTITTKSENPTIEIYKEMEYDYLGAIISETLPMTLTEKNGNNKIKYKILYDYWSKGDLTILNAPSSVTWYPDIDKEAVNETRTFDNQGRITSFTNANGEKTEYDYTGSSLEWMPKTVTISDVNNFDLLNYQNKFEYSSWHYKTYPAHVKEYDENGNAKVRDYSYDRFFDVLTSYVDENGEFTEYYYDDLARPFYTAYPPVQGVNGDLYIVDKYDYDMEYATPQHSNRHLYKITNTRWSFNDYYYDYNGDGQNDGNAQGTLIKTKKIYLDDQGKTMLNQVIAPDNSSISEKFEYDTALRLSKYTDGEGNHDTYTYDGLGRNTYKTNMVGDIYSTVYGTDTIEEYFTASGGNPENHLLKTYDIRGNLINTKTYPNGKNGSPLTQTYDHDLMGNVKTYTDAKGKSTNFEYNALNQTTKVKYPETAIGEYNTTSYSKNGKPTFDRQYSGSDNHSVANVYNSHNLLAFRTDYAPKAAMQMESYSYSPRGNLIKKIDKNANVTLYDYDSAQNLISSKTTEDTINYYYSPHGNIELYDYTGHTDLEKGEDVFGRINSRTEGTFTTSYAYDNNNNLTYQTDPFDLTTEYIYNNLKQLDYLIAGGKTFDYEYYPNGMLKKIAYPNNVYTEYQYDNVNRVTSVVTKQGTTTKSSYSYTYDNNGNITSENSTTYSYDARNRLSSPAIDYYGNRIDYEYEGINRLVNDGTNEYTYDNNGNTLSKGEDSFVYDKRNKMISSTADGVTTNYVYNAEGLRTDKGDTHYHLNENGKVIAESVNGSVTAQIIWADRPLARKIGPNWYYYIFNAHGDVVALMDESGSFVNTYSYDAWGNITSQTETIDNPIKYAGEYLDNETGLYYLRNRYYDPTIGRFTQEDPTRDGDNWYVYAGNNPVVFIDPWGLSGIMPDGSYYITHSLDRQLLRLKQEYGMADLTRQAQIAQEAANIRASGKEDVDWSVRADKSLDYYTIYDITEKLNNLMRSNRELFEKHRGDYIWFKNNVGYGRIFDIKVQNEWQKEHFIYDGQVLRGDAPGNIVYGYLGKAAHFSDITLKIAAGIAQQSSKAGQPVKRSWILTSWGDAPGDWEFIKIGIEAWKKDVNYNPWNVNPFSSDINKNYGWW